MTIAFSFAILFMPSASRIVTTAGSPSGIAATAKLIAVMKSANGSPPCKRPTAKIMAQIARKRMPRILPRRFKFSCRGVASVSILFRRSAIFPISVLDAVETTIPSPRPYVISVPLNTMLSRSPMPGTSSYRAIASLCTGTDSPVNADSFACKLADKTSLKSAGTTSPAISSTRSPGTSSAAGTSRISPPRLTRAKGADIFFRASSAFSARFS